MVRAAHKANQGQGGSAAPPTVREASRAADGTKRSSCLLPASCRGSMDYGAWRHGAGTAWSASKIAANSFFFFHRCTVPHLAWSAPRVKQPTAATSRPRPGRPTAPRQSFHQSTLPPSCNRGRKRRRSFGLPSPLANFSLLRHRPCCASATSIKFAILAGASTLLSPDLVLQRQRASSSKSQFPITNAKAQAH